jgi:hypothetical protein
MSPRNGLIRGAAAIQVGEALDLLTVVHKQPMRCARPGDRHRPRGPVLFPPRVV